MHDEYWYCKLRGVAMYFVLDVDRQLRFLLTLLDKTLREHSVLLLDWTYELPVATPAAEYRPLSVAN